MLLGTIIINVVGLLLLGILAFLMNTDYVDLGYARWRAIGEMMGYVSLGVFLSCIAAVYYWLQNPAENQRQAMIAIGIGAVYLLLMGAYVVTFFLP